MPKPKPEPTPPGPPAPTLGAHCRTCKGHRLHEIKVAPLIGPYPGIQRKVSVRVCTACYTQTVLPGLHCPACGDPRSKCLFLRRPRPGVATRVRECLSCKGRFRTAERFEAMKC